MSYDIELKDLEYGNPAQQQAYREVMRLNLFERLKVFNPTIAGTVPINLETAKSDLDIVCQCDSHTVFKRVVHQYYSNEPDFTIKSKLIENVKSTIARFQGRFFLVELFAQKTPVTQQRAYRQMIVEKAILDSQPATFRQEIRTLKVRGLTTEEAFVKLLDLPGDPFEALFNYGRQHFNLP